MKRKSGVQRADGLGAAAVLGSGEYVSAPAAVAVVAGAGLTFLQQTLLLR